MRPLLLALLLLSGPALAEQTIFDQRGNVTGHVRKETGGDNLRLYDKKGDFRGTIKVEPEPPHQPYANPSALVPPTPYDPCSVQSVAAKCPR